MVTVAIRGHVDIVPVNDWCGSLTSALLSVILAVAFAVVTFRRKVSRHKSRIRWFELLLILPFAKETQDL